MEERLRNILFQAKGGSRNIDELHKELFGLFNDNQRELLIFFLSHLNKSLNLGVSEMWVDDFINIGKKN
jgi:hypothetical protein